MFIAVAIATYGKWRGSCRVIVWYLSSLHVKRRSCVEEGDLLLTSAEKPLPSPFLRVLLTLVMWRHP
jgi:hypothetical protein